MNGTQLNWRVGFKILRRSERRVVFLEKASAPLRAAQKNESNERTDNERDEAARRREKGLRIGFENVSGTRYHVKLETPPIFTPFRRSGVFRCRIDVTKMEATNVAPAKITIVVRVRDLENWV